LLDLRRGVSFDRALERHLGGLVGGDRRLAHQLAAGVLRHGDRLDAELAPRLRQGLAGTPPVVRELLRLGLYQLRQLDRVPDHAAVTTAVGITRERLGPRPAGLVNAVLRGLARDADPLADEGPSPDIATAHSHPAWLVERWRARFGDNDTEALLEWNNSHPPLVIQPRDGDVDALTRRFADAGVLGFPAPFGAGLVVEATRPDTLPDFAAGTWYVQDPAQALVVRFAAFPDRSVVYDACAAPGGKTLALAPRSRLVLAGERAERRLPRLRANIARMRVPNVRVVRADAAEPPFDRVDAILLDAPCLGTGTFARHPDARLRVQPQALTRLVEQQSVLLDALADRLRPGGVLCYATCSLEPEENAIQIDRFLQRRPDFRRAPALSGEVPMTERGDLEILPQRDAMDGAFAARLVRDAGAT
jgi:16S rRNA (cytosine967-C5)-methyltransferase